MKIIDIHTHTGVPSALIPFTLSDARKSMDANGISHMAVFPQSRKPEERYKLVEDSLENTRMQVKGILPFMRFKPSEELLRNFAQFTKPFYGFKFHAREEAFDPLGPEATATFIEIGRTGKPVIIHSRKEDNANTNPDRIIEMCDRYPGINFIFAHFANDSSGFFNRLLEYPNAYVDTSIVSSPKIIQFRVEQVGADRILFGSDMPYSDQELELLKVKRADISDADRHKILYGNAARLLRL